MPCVCRKANAASFRRLFDELLKHDVFIPTRSPLVSPALFNEAGDTAVFSAVPATSPTDQATKDLALFQDIANRFHGGDNRLPQR